MSTSTDGITWAVATQNTKLGDHSWVHINLIKGKLVALGSTGYLSTKQNLPVISATGTLTKK